MDQERVDISINACFESLEKAFELIDEDPELISEKTDLGETPLHYLAVENQLDAVKFLFSRGANLNTILHMGCIWGRPGSWAILATKGIPQNWSQQPDHIAQLCMSKQKVNVKLYEFINNINDFRNSF